MNGQDVLESVERQKILNLENIVRTMPQLELQTDHYFADGMYCRVVARPKGALIVGKIHKREHLYIVAKGKVQVGETVYEAGSIVVSQPGTKRAVYALEDSICLTVHRTKKRNLDKIEKQLIEPDDRALFNAQNKLKELL